MSEDKDSKPRSKPVSPTLNVSWFVLVLLVLVLLTPLSVLFSAGSDDTTVITLPAICGGCWLIAVLAIGWFYSLDSNKPLDEDG